MDREQARQEIRAHWKDFSRPDGKGRGIVCPLCDSGSGKTGTGISENPHKPGQLKCWACGFSGDAIDLYAKAWGIDNYNDALHAAADFLGITIDDYRPGGAAKITPAGRAEGAGAARQGRGTETPTEQKKAAQAGREAANRGITDYSAYYQECRERLTDPAALSYLQARGISKDTAEAYYLGYDPEWISPTVVKRQREKGNDWTPPGTARVIIPVTKSHYIARAIRPAQSDKAKSLQKMNETGGGGIGIFNSGAMYGNESVFVVEGVFDALSIIEAGGAAVALNSTANAGKLLQGLEAEPTRATLIICLDNDPAGRKAAETLRAGLDRLNIGHIAANISGRFKDPNEALTGDRDAFMRAVNEAQARTAARPDSTATYIDTLMQGDIERLKASADRRTGFDQLDRESGGLYPGLYVLGAISSLGKTTFAGQIADNLAGAGHDVLFFSLEMSRLELVTKSLARIHAQAHPDGEAISSLSFRKGFYRQELQAAASAYKAKTAGRVNVIEGNFSCNVAFVGEYVRQYIRRVPCRPVVFIDYLQILQPAEGFKGTMKEAIDSVMTELKRLSRELNITIVAISSLNRNNYLFPIDFESFKESGGIEYSADCVLGLQLQCLEEDLFSKEKHTKEKRERVRRAKAENPRKVELICLKNRFGKPSYCVGFEYFPAQDLFRELPEPFEPVGDGENPFTDQKITARF